MRSKCCNLEHRVIRSRMPPLVTFLQRWSSSLVRLGQFLARRARVRSVRRAEPPSLTVRTLTAPRSGSSLSRPPVRGPHTRRARMDLMARSTSSLSSARRMLVQSWGCQASLASRLQVEERRTRSGEERWERRRVRRLSGRERRERRETGDKLLAGTTSSLSGPR